MFPRLRWQPLQSGNLRVQKKVAQAFPPPLLAVFNGAEETIVKYNIDTLLSCARSLSTCNFQETLLALHTMLVLFIIRRWYDSIVPMTADSIIGTMKYSAAYWNAMIFKCNRSVEEEMQEEKWIEMDSPRTQSSPPARWSGWCWGFSLTALHNHRAVVQKGSPQGFWPDQHNVQFS